ncbi:cytochrome-c peroxidase [Prosthecomicrobium sp. N25]|uniref:cytochrome-c peroxidase n=1 Tax=Prosthecomicrobium sp. N25 TaxID=3129254 RepID=UPI0030782ED4
MGSISFHIIKIGIFVLMTLQATVMSEAAEPAKSAYKRPSEIPFPIDNPYTAEKAALGKALYFEPRLSGAENMTCASCHNPSFGWEVPVKTAVGAQNTRLGRQAPTVLNIAWVHPLFWDGRAKTAEDQAKGPIEAAVEMNLPLPEAVKRLSAIPSYKAAFDRVFPGQGVTPDTIVKAIATFERTVVASYAPFDAWVEGDEKAISPAAKRGFDLFVGKAGCAPCHTGWNFTDNKFHDIGTTSTDVGRIAFEPNNPKAQFAFKTPSLRDIGQRAPYMHDGSIETLEEALMHYVQGGIDRPSRSPLMRPVALDASEIDDLIAFLRSLTGSKQIVTLPVLPN